MYTSKFSNRYSVGVNKKLVQTVSTHSQETSSIIFPKRITGLCCQDSYHIPYPPPQPPTPPAQQLATLLSLRCTHSNKVILWIGSIHSYNAKHMQPHFFPPPHLLRHSSLYCCHHTPQHSDFSGYHRTPVRSLFISQLVSPDTNM